jgi:stage V sporulation protein D (sporulation-specific penicillin-binding protein)
VFKIRCHSFDKGGHGTLDVKGAIAESCNDYLMHIGKLLGKEDFAKYQSIFGFGTKTGIDLPGETRGLVYDKNMGLSTLMTNAFGQNFTVNMIQMTAGFSSLINGGNYYEPRVVKQIVKPNGEVAKNYSKTLVKQTITRDTSNFIKQCLRAVVTDGTGSTAAIEGYTVGGKTGTAEKVDTSGKGKGRLRNQYILSFLGCVPCENPQVVCYTLMDTPKENPQATAFNTDLWTYIMKQVLPYMGIEKTAGVEKKAIKQKMVQEFYSDGIIEGDDGSLVLKEDEE